jgi:hypothetical protein
MNLSKQSVDKELFSGTLVKENTIYQNNIKYILLQNITKYYKILQNITKYYKLLYSLYFIVFYCFFYKNIFYFYIH